MRAPSFPADAEMPWHMARIFVGKTSHGIKKVVQLGPHCPKNELPKYMTTNHVEERRSFRQPHRRNNVPVMMKPVCWSATRPQSGSSTTAAAA
mmetsp:Transcript_34074/g.62806  ORF Transcript_34074/g.62806 Transcript_34074/m.62806 type:complete len:93 (+) Transcript_34074:306-584(+)